MTRVFVALPIPDAMRDPLVSAQRGLPFGRLVPEENLHLTLVFLGDLSDADLERAHEALEGVAHPPVALTVEGVGTFGGTRPRALWAGVRPDAGLIALQGRVLRRLRGVGLALDARKFVPHVTLARFRHGTVEDVALQRFIAGRAGLSCAPEVVLSFALMASELRPEGAVYEALAVYPLR